MPVYLPTGVKDELDSLRFSNKSQDDIAALDWEQKSLDDIGSFSQPTPTPTQAFSAPDAPVYATPQPTSLALPRRPVDPTAGQIRTAWKAPGDQTPDIQSFAAPRTPTPGVAAPPMSAPSGLGGPSPSAMPTGAPAASGPQAAGAIDNSSRASFVRTAYPYALQAADGDPKLAQQLLATAISENGKVGTGRDLGEMGFNVGGIQGVEGTAGSFTALDAGRPRQFAAYRDLSEGFRAVKDLMSSGRYAAAAATYRQTGDIDRYWREVNEAGYSETPTWQDGIANIRRNQVEPIVGGIQNAVAPTAAAPSLPSGGGAPSEDVAQAALDDPDKWSLCGPVAAVIAAGKRGAGWTVAQAKKIAVENKLWDSETGMYGLSAQVQLLKQMGINAATGAADVGKLAADALAGNTPIISTSRHYFVLKGYDPETGRFDTTTSGTALKGGSRWLTLDQIEKLGNGIQGAAYIDNPTSPVSSAGVDAYKATPSDMPLPDGGPSAGDQKRQKMSAQNGGPGAMPGAVYGPAGTASEMDPVGVQSSDAKFPVDGRPPGQMPYDTVGPEGEDRTNDPLMQPPTLRTPTMSGNGVAAGAMYRQPLNQPTQGDTLTGDYANPDDGPRESGYTLPPEPAAYGGAGDAQGAAPYTPVRGAVEDGASAPVVGPDSATTSPRSTYAPPPSYNDPTSNGTQSQPLPAQQPAPEAESPLKPLYDMGGRIIGYVKAGTDAAYQGLAPLRDAAASLDGPSGYGQVQANAGEPDYVSQGGAVTRALNTPIRPPERPKPLVGPFDLSNETAFPTQESRNRFTTGAGAAQDVANIPYQAAEAGRAAVMDAARSFADAIRAGQDGRPLAAAGNALWSALQVAGLPWTVAAGTINEMLPEMNIGGVGVGDAATSMDLLNLGIKGVNGLHNGALGRVLSPENLARADDAVRAGAGAVGRGARALGEEGVRQLMDLTPSPRMIQDGGVTIGRGGAPMENPNIWTTRSTADAFHPEWADPGFLDEVGIPAVAPRRVTPDTSMFHLTSPAALERIAVDGLGPRVGDARGAGAGEVFLADGGRATRRPSLYAADSAGILSTVDRDVYETTDWALLRFKRGDRRWTRDPEFGREDPGSWLTRNNVSPDEIEVYTPEGWRPLTEVVTPRGEPPAKPSLGTRVRGALADNAERVAAADARIAREGSTVAPGTLGVVTGNPLEASRAASTRVIPPHVSDTLDFPIRIPEDPAVIKAIEAAGGSVDPERGVNLNVIRYQGPEAHGRPATRSSTFYTADKPGSPSPYAAGKGAQVGGTDRIEAPTTYRSPLVLSDAPGSNTGFDAGIRAIGATVPNPPSRIAGYETRLRNAEQQLADVRARKSGDPGYGPEWLASAERYVEDARAGLEAAKTARLPITAREIDDGISAARRAGPPGSPERAQALKDLVTRYGGDPEAIPHLLEVRGADDSESAWAIKENILAHNARAKGYDGVLTVQQTGADEAAVSAHPKVKAAAAKSEAVQQMLEDALDAHQKAYEDAIPARFRRSPDEGFNQWYERVVKGNPEYDAALRRAQEQPSVIAAEKRASRVSDAAQEAEAAFIKAAEDVRAELGGGKITELADFRESHNPTPGGRPPEYAAAHQQVEDLGSRLEVASQVADDAERAGDDTALRYAMREYNAVRREYDAAVAAREALRDASGTPGYTLRPDLPRRPGAPDVPLSTIETDPRLAVAEQRVKAAEEAERLANTRYELDAARKELKSARASLAQLRRANPPRTVQSSVNATAGTLPRGASTDRLGAVNRALGQGLASSVSGGVGAQVNQEMNPDDPYAGVKGFAAGALVPLAAARGAGAVARRMGARGERAGGALAALGHVPDDAAAAQREMRAAGSALPGMEDLAADRFDPARPRVPGATVGQARKAQGEMRRAGGYLPELDDPLRPVGPTQLPTDAEREAARVPSRPLREALPDIIRSLNEPPTIRAASNGPAEMRAAGAAGLPSMEPNPGVVRRFATTISEALAPLSSRISTLRYAGMLSDTAGQVFNNTSNLIMAGVDVATTPVTVGLDMGRVVAARATGRNAERAAFMSEVGARWAGMQEGARVGLQAAGEVMRTGLKPGEAEKLEQTARGFASGNAVVDFAAELPLRLMGASDALFRTTAMGGHIMAEATAEATRIARKTGQEVTSELIREAAKQTKVLDRAQEMAARSVLQEDRNLTTKYRKFINDLDPTTRLLVSAEVPFVRTPYNVVAQGMEMSPVGLISVARDIKAGKAPREVEHKLARVMIGTAVMGAAWADYSSGNLTGPYPTDEKERSTLPPGWRPWSRKFTVGGETYYVPLAVLGPLALPPVMAILAVETAKKGKEALTPGWAGKVALGVGAYAAQQTFLDGFVQVGKVLENPDRQLESHWEGLAASYAPHIIGGGALGREIQRVTGMPARDPEGGMEALMATFPYLANRVEPRQDVLGRPASLGMGGPAGAVIRAGQENDAAVIRAYRRAGEGLPTQAPKQIDDPTTGGPKTLSPRERHQWRREFGAALREGWDNRGGPEDADALKKIEAEARKAASQTVLGLR